MIGRFMTVSRQQNSSAQAHAAADGSQYSAGASIYQIMRLLRMIKFSRLLLYIF